VRTRIRERLRDSGRAFSASARNHSLRRAQLSFGAAWTAEWAFTVALGVVAFRDGGATAVGVVAFVQMAPSALLSPFGTELADRFPPGAQARRPVRGDDVRPSALVHLADAGGRSTGRRPKPKVAGSRPVVRFRTLPRHAAFGLQSGRF
jgi:hypothetical protein